MKRKDYFKIGDVVKVRETSSVGEILTIYKIGRKEMLFLKMKNNEKIKIPSSSCGKYN